MRLRGACLALGLILGCSRGERAAPSIGEAPAHVARLGASHLHELDVVLADDAIELSRGDASVRIVREDVVTVPAETLGRRLVHRELARDTDAFVVLGARAVEELRVLRTPVAPTTLRYRFAFGGAVVKAVVTPDRWVELLDAGGNARFRAAPAWAIDGKGTRRDLEARVEGEHLVYRLDPAELTFPVTVDPSWTSTAAPKVDRAFAPLVSLPSGKVLYLGSEYQNGRSTEIFDPATSTWTTGPQMVLGRSSSAAWALDTGKVLVVSDRGEAQKCAGACGCCGPNSTGCTSDGSGNSICAFDNASSRPELYDPTSNSFTLLPTLPSAYTQAGQIGASTSAGAVFVAWTGSANGLVAFESATNGFVDAGLTTFQPSGFARIASGRALFTSAGKAAVYDPTARSVTNVAPPLVDRTSSEVVGLSDGRALVMEGYLAGLSYAQVPEIFTPPSSGIGPGTWTTLKTLSSAGGRSGGFVLETVAGKDRVFSLGGTDAITGRATTAGEILDLGRLSDPGDSTSFGVFLPASAPSTLGAVRHYARLPGGRVLAVGFGAGTTTPAAAIFQPVAYGASCANVGDCAAGFCTEGVCCSASACASGETCAGPSGAGSCRKKNGGACTGASDCASGNCVDGVCCNSSCTGPCGACDVPGKVGTCSPVGFQEAPHGARSCPGTAPCTAKCGGVRMDACTWFPDASTSCAPKGCSDASHASSATSCTGAGACTAPIIADCGKYACAAGTCKTSCGAASDCAPGYGCLAGACQKGAIGADCAASADCFTGSCVDGVCCGSASCSGGAKCNVVGRRGECTKPNGASCSAGAECGSTFCADGVCCDGQCAGVCEACNLPGLVGTCSAVSGPPAAGRAPCGGTGTCAGACDGKVRGACVYPGASITCGAASCAAGIAIVAATCDGAGGCGQPNKRACDPYACAGDVCATACTTDAECGLGAGCVDGKCALVPKCDGNLLVSPDGTSRDCAPQACAKGKCVVTCTTSLECAPGYVCDVASGACNAPSPAAESDSSGCSVEVPGAPTPPWILLLLLPGLLVRRRGGAR